MDIEQKAIEIYALRTIEAEKLKLNEKQQLAKTTAHWYKECERLQERIRELEQQWNEMREAYREETDMTINLTKHISKAREILQSFNLATCDQKIIDALWVLEGK